LATWGTVIFLFFSISGAKLPHYVLPVTAPFGLLVADDLARRWGEVSRRRLVWRAALAAEAGARANAALWARRAAADRAGRVPAAGWTAGRVSAPRLVALTTTSAGDEFREPPLCFGLTVDRHRGKVAPRTCCVYPVGSSR